eukprot:scaffold4545_cov139-Amphora_coffeaeformis.AAC.10
MAAYFWFTRSVRDEIRRQNPTANFGELMALMTDAFAELSEEEIDRYAAMASSTKTPTTTSSSSRENRDQTK